jgi:hypothetical protein
LLISSYNPGYANSGAPPASGERRLLLPFRSSDLLVDVSMQQLKKPEFTSEKQSGARVFPAYD